MIFTTKLIIALTYLGLINVAAFVYCLVRRTQNAALSSLSSAAIYILACAGGAIGAMFGVLLFHRERRTRTFRISGPVILVCHMVIFFFVYTGIYYHADEIAVDTTADQMNETSCFFDGPGTDDLIIFYPGAKVEAHAYAPLMRKIADAGVDCYLLHTPYNLAVLNTEEASEIDTSGYSHVYVAGHSMGGAVAGMYAAKHKADLSGVIFLAAYPTKSLKQDGFRALSIVGSNDGGYRAEKWKTAEEYMPNEFQFSVIEGGNHGNFGNYGFQNGDGEAAISREQQQDMTAEMIAEFVLGK